MEKSHLKMKRIGLLGLTFSDPNKGCEALTYTFLKVLRDFYSEQDIEIICIWNSNNFGQIPKYFPELKLEAYVLNIYSVASWIGAYQKIKTCSCVFDASYGDGFTGIYGARRNFVQALRKQLVCWANKPLYLLPQTYGKYTPIFQKWSISLIKRAKLAYARDITTARVVGDFVRVTSDMAFGLPFDKNKYPMSSCKTRIGLNVSSLLWDEATVGRFGLTVEYKKFYTELLDYLTNKSEYEVHLIPHVIDVKNYQSGENDCRILDEIKSKYGYKVIQAPAFANCIEAKSYIANMDIFLGSRMHATIGAISSGVVTIPFSYCHKFESLYGNINYPYLISATKISTEEALLQARNWINNPETLRNAGIISVEGAKSKLKEFEYDLEESLKKENLI